MAKKTSKNYKPYGEKRTKKNGGKKQNQQTWLPTNQSDVFGGIDVHKDSLVGGLWQGRDPVGPKKTFPRTIDGILKLLGWLRANNCRSVAMESTGIYWCPVYAALEDEGMEVILANAREVKHVPGPKTDARDALWLAKLNAAGLLRPSYVPEQCIRELRELTRYYVKLGNTRTAYKNKVHGILEEMNIKLGKVFSDLFGRSGMLMLHGLCEGKTVDEIIDGSSNPHLRKKRDAIIEALQSTLSKSKIILLRSCIEMIEKIKKERDMIQNAVLDHLNEMSAEEDRIEVVDAAGGVSSSSTRDSAKKDGSKRGRNACKEVGGERKEREHHKYCNMRTLGNIMRIEGVGMMTATGVLAELGDIDRFENDKQVSSWIGIAPAVYQSGGVTRYGRITKHGNKWLRRSLCLVANNVRMRQSDSRLRRFYDRIKSRKGWKKAAVAVGNKLAKLIYHLMKTGEAFKEERPSKKQKRVRIKSVHVTDPLGVYRSGLATLANLT